MFHLGFALQEVQNQFIGFLEHSAEDASLAAAHIHSHADREKRQEQAGHTRILRKPPGVSDCNPVEPRTRVCPVK